MPFERTRVQLGPNQFGFFLEVFVIKYQVGEFKRNQIVSPIVVISKTLEMTQLS